MDEKKPFKVVIIGGSVAGLTMANMLQLNGIDFVVLEAYPKIAPQVGASIGLLPHGSRILDQLGVFDIILNMAPPVEQFNFRDHTGTRIAGHGGMRRTFEQRHGYPILFLDRQMVLQVLYDNIKDKSKVLTEKRLEKIELHENGVTALMKDGSTYSGDFIFGGDGIHSTTRSEMWRLAGDRGPPGYFPVAEHNDVPCDFSCIFGISKPIPGLEPGNLHSVFREKTSYLINGGPEKRVYFFFLYKLEKTLYGSDIPKYTKEEEARVLKEHYNDPITPEIKFGDLQDKMICSVLTPLPEYVYKKWHYDRIITIGDSAHKVHPIAGHGGNLAMESAATLTNSLVKALKQNNGSLTTPQLHKIFEDLQAQKYDRAVHLKDASHEQQLTEAMCDPLHKFAALKLLPMMSGEDTIFNFSGNIPAAEKLDMVQLPPRARLVPFKDELACDPKSRGPVAFLQIGFYLACAALGYYGMWVRGITGFGVNEQVTAILKDGTFEYEGSAALRTSFTGIGSVDSLLAMFSAIYLPGTAGYDKPYGTLLLYFLGMLVQPVSIFMIEACRKRNDMNLLALPTIWFALGQAFGFGVVAPFWYIAYTLFSDGEPYWWPATRQVTIHYVRVLLPAILIGYVLPTVLLFVPWNSGATSQTIAAIWQGSSLYASLLTLLFSLIYKKLASDPKDLEYPAAAEQPKDIPWLKVIYGIIFILGFVLHVSVLSSILCSNTPELTLRSVFFLSSASTLGDQLRNTFLADFLAFELASYGWCCNAVWDLKRVGRTNVDVGKAAIVLLLANVIVGPGAALAGCWYWREGAMARTNVARK